MPSLAARGALLHRLYSETLPEGLVGLVQVAGEVGAALVASDVDMIAFTGSIATGQAIMRAASEALVSAREKAAAEKEKPPEKKADDSVREDFEPMPPTLSTVKKDSR